MKKRINIEDVEKLLEERRKINIIPFENIEWYKNGKKLILNPKILEEYKFMGLNNTDFVRFKVYLDNS
jgi:hypothetical protein